MLLFLTTFLGEIVAFIVLFNEKNPSSLECREGSCAWGGGTHTQWTPNLLSY